MEKGYSNASFFFNAYGKHSYVGLPFVFGDNKKKGFILIDPTSDQLFEDKKNAPRNNLFVASGDSWEYKTDWEYGQDLFPSSDDKSMFSNLHTLREVSMRRSYGSRDIKEYFSSVFENPVDVLS
jgi:hypothetical protein